jgi:hypothetical protein
MNWEAIGAVGDFVSGVGVIVTLGYLAVQIRQNTRAQRYESHVRSRILIAEFQKLQANPASADIWLRGLRDPNELTEQERWAFHNLLYLFMNPIEARVMAPDAPLVDATATNVVIDVFADRAGFRDWWKEARPVYSKTFRDQVDERLSKAGTLEGS